MKETLFIDIGSNTIKSLLASLESNQVKALGEFSLPRRISSKNGLADDAADIITSSVLELNSLAKSKLNKPFETVCFGTSALRDSPNAKEVLRQLLLRGICVRVLTGKEEAMLSFRGAMGDESLKGRPKLNVLYGDLGGGSMEFVSKSGFDTFPDSFPVGAVRLTNMFTKDGSLDVASLRDFCREIFLKIKLPAGDFDFVISGGAITAARRILGGGNMSANKCVTMQDINFCLKEAISLKADGLSKKYGTPKNRADILPAAFLCIIELLKTVNRNYFIHTRRSLRYGVAELYYGI